MDERVPDPLPPPPLRRLLVACGRSLFRVRDFLFPIIVLVMVMTTSPGAPAGPLPLDPWLDALGFAIACLGQAVRLAAIGSVTSIRRGGDRRSIAAESLIRNGVYTASRNPLYVGDWLIVCGLVLIANCRWWYLFVLPGFTFCYVAIVLAEEDFLLRKFGEEYRAYTAAVPRFLPSGRSLLRLRSLDWDWRRAFGKEARIICSWLAVALVLFLREEWTHLGAAMWRTGATHALVAALLLVFTSRAILQVMARNPTRVRTPGSAAASTRPPDRP